MLGMQVSYVLRNTGARADAWTKLPDLAAIPKSGTVEVPHQRKTLREGRQSGTPAQFGFDPFGAQEPLRNWYCLELFAVSARFARAI